MTVYTTRQARFTPTANCLYFATVCLFLFFSASVQAKPTQIDLDKAMKSLLVCYPVNLIEVKEPEVLLKSEELCLSHIYNDLGPTPLWVTPDGPTRKAEIILSYIRDSFFHGLNPQEYNLNRLRELWNKEDPDSLALLDTSLTYSLVRYIHDISHGQLKVYDTDPELFAEAGKKDFDPVFTVKRVLTVPDLDNFLAQLPPQHAHYRRLQSALIHYRHFAGTGGWPQLDSGESIRPGDSDKRIETVRKRLQITGELKKSSSGSSSNPYVFDPELVDAVKLFQKHHGLTQDGIIGKKTRAAMNITAHQKVDMIRLNLARWRWHAHELGHKYILVNIAGFNLKAFNGNDDEPSLDFAVIVGQDRHQTPVFSDRILYLDFNPFWNVTPSIAANEELPALRKDPEHLTKRNIRLFSSWQQNAVELDSTTMDWDLVTPGEMRGYKLRQDPGPWNALGKVKFIFPNRYSVYMHDTASPGLFRRTQRDFSHGCIRVSDPLELAVFLLTSQDTGWTREKVVSLYDQESRKVIRLDEPVPVHITYQTAWVDKEGVINFNSDIYARDERLLTVLIQ